MKLMKKNNFLKKKVSGNIVALLLIIFFCWGFISSTFKIFPFSIIRNIYWNFATTDKPNDKNNNRIPYITKFFTDKKFINFQKNIVLKKFKIIEKNSNLFRQKIIDKYILPDEIIKFDKLDVKEISNKKVSIQFQDHEFQNYPSKDSILLKVRYYGINHFGVLETTQNNKKLLIYHQGHGGNPYNYDYFLQLKEKFKSKGFDILSLSMSGIGFNMLENPDYSFPINTEKNSEISFNYKFSFRNFEEHDIYQFYYDENHPNIMPIALMLSGNYYLIKNIENNYDQIIMLGISGGGWYTTMLSALLPKIHKSYSFHAFFPKIFNLNRYLRADWEFSGAKIWDKYDYWDFYFLSLFDSENSQNREHHLIYNLKHKRFEDYNVPFANLFKKLVDYLSIDNLEVALLDKDKHEIDIKFLENYILKKLD